MIPYGRSFSTTIIKIAIGGSTNSGKTTLGRQLTEMFPNSVILKIDDYIRPPHWKKHEMVEDESANKMPNFDREEAHDFQKLINDINKYDVAPNDHRNVKIIIVEGIFATSSILLEAVNFDLIFFITMPKDEAKERRSLRKYEIKEPTCYFDESVWPNYLRILKEVENEENIVFLNGTNSIVHNFQTVVQRIQEI
ncbi:hypothetical protein SNEBB_003340 [Seison nebaliae]|nr:hypothetical protein SNEBB_003340 [Seison nebaliae]